MFENGCIHDIRVKNLSSIGLGAILIKPLAGLSSLQKVKLVIRDDIIIYGYVSWVNGRLFGVRFIESINVSSMIVSRDILSKPGKKIPTTL